MVFSSTDAQYSIDQRVIIFQFGRRRFMEIKAERNGMISQVAYQGRTPICRPATARRPRYWRQYGTTATPKASPPNQLHQPRMLAHALPPINVLVTD